MHADGHVTAALPHHSDTDVPASPSTTVNCDPHPAPTGGDVAPSMASHPHPPPPPYWVLCSHIVMAGPPPASSPGRLRDALNFV